MNAWINQSKISLVGTFGPPDQKESDGKEGGIYVTKLIQVLGNPVLPGVLEQKGMFG